MNQITEKVDMHDDEAKVFHSKVQESFELVQSKQKDQRGMLGDLKLSQDGINSKINALQMSIDEMKAQFEDHKTFTETSFSEIVKMLKEIQESIGNP